MQGIHSAATILLRSRTNRFGGFGSALRDPASGLTERFKIDYIFTQLPSTETIPMSEYRWILLNKIEVDGFDP